MRSFFAINGTRFNRLRKEFVNAIWRLVIDARVTFFERTFELFSDFILKTFRKKRLERCLRQEFVSKQSHIIYDCPQFGLKNIKSVFRGKWKFVEGNFQVILTIFLNSFDNSNWKLTNIQVNLTNLSNFERTFWIFGNRAGFWTIFWNIKHKQIVQK